MAKLLKERKHEGKLEDANAVATEEHPLCEDKVSFYIRIEGDRIKKAGYEAYHCASAIAASELTAELIEGKTLEEAEKLTLGDIERVYGELGKTNKCCKEVALWAMKKAIASYKGEA